MIFLISSTEIFPIMGSGGLCGSVAGVNRAGMGLNVSGLLEMKSSTMYLWAGSKWGKSGVFHVLGKQLCSGWVSGSSGVVELNVRVDFSFSLSSQLLKFSPELFRVFSVVNFSQASVHCFCVV